jgi:hypothetical protein
MPSYKHILCQFKYFRNLSKLTLKTCSLDSFLLTLLVFSTHNRPGMKQLKYLNVEHVYPSKIYPETINSMNAFGFGPNKIQLSELKEININDSIHLINDLSLGTID